MGAIKGATGGGMKVVGMWEGGGIWGAGRVGGASANS